MVYEMSAQFGSVRILVVSANGHREPVPIAEMTEQHWRFVIDVARLAARYQGDETTAERSFRVLATINPTFVESNSTEGGTG